MRVPAVVRSAWVQTSSAARRLGDLLGPGVVAAVIVAVVLLGALIGHLAQETWQIVSAALLLLVLVAAVGLTAARLLQPIRTLSRDVDRTATETLPALAAAFQAGAGPDALPGLTPIAVRGPQEVIALGGAVTSLGAGAMSLAMQEHDRHRRTRDLTTHLARRNHGLVDRLVTQISELETAERSPSVLTQLSRLKHTATRTRRHSESMLLLTGALPRPIPAPAGSRCRRTARRADRDRGPRPGRHRRRGTGGRPRLGRRGPGSPDGRARREQRPLLAARHPYRSHRRTGARRPRLPHPRHRSRSRHDGCSARRGERPYPRRGGGGGADKVDRAGRRRAPRGPTRDHGDARSLWGVERCRRHRVGPRGACSSSLSELPAPRRPVSALVAAAAFRPPLAARSREPAATAAPTDPRRERTPEPDAVAAPEFVRPGCSTPGPRCSASGPRTGARRTARTSRRTPGASKGGWTRCRPECPRHASTASPRSPQHLPGDVTAHSTGTGSPQATPAPAPDGDD